MDEKGIKTEDEQGFVESVGENLFGVLATLYTE